MIGKRDPAGVKGLEMLRKRLFPGRIRSPGPPFHFLFPDIGQPHFAGIPPGQDQTEDLWTAYIQRIQTWLHGQKTLSEREFSVAGK